MFSGSIFPLWIKTAVVSNATMMSTKAVYRCTADFCLTSKSYQEFIQKEPFIGQCPACGPSNNVKPLCDDKS